MPNPSDSDRCNNYMFVSGGKHCLPFKEVKFVRIFLQLPTNSIIKGRAKFFSFLQPHQLASLSVLLRRSSKDKETFSILVVWDVSHFYLNEWLDLVTAADVVSPLRSHVSPEWVNISLSANMSRDLTAPQQQRSNWGRTVAFLGKLIKSIIN